MELKNKKALIIGTGKSGVASAGLLKQAKAQICLFDSNPEVKKTEVLQRFEELKTQLPMLKECVLSEAELTIGTLSEEELAGIGLAVVSPGVPVDSPMVLMLKERGIRVIGEIELAYQFAKGKLVAITGTNGKTTTTALTGEIMKSWYREVFVVGNIGIPYTNRALETTEQSVTVAEISSFQLETTDAFHPQVSAVLNITPDHLNRHHTMEVYIDTKLSITKRQTEEDVCVLNYEDEVLRARAEGLSCRVVFFSSSRKLENGYYLENDCIMKNENGVDQKLLAVQDMKLLGKHNYENVMAAIAIAEAMGVPMDCIIRTVCAFSAVEHRIEYVAEKRGVKYYNDSKGTNPDAAIQGIRAMVRPTLLIGGGYDKGSVYSEWIKSFDGKVRYLVLIGQTREKIKEEAEECGFDSVILADSLEEAVAVCAKKARPGDAVLLSPACASWGMFENYEQRGNLFKDYVHQLPE